jgi:hypothetical protein
MRLLNNYSRARKSLGITQPAKTINYYPLMRKLAEPAPVKSPAAQAQPQAPAPQQQAQAQPQQQAQPQPQAPVYKPAEGQAYKAPTVYTGDTDKDIATEMERLRAEDRTGAIYGGDGGREFLRRRAQQNVFDANPNMDYDSFSANDADASLKQDPNYMRDRMVDQTERDNRLGGSRAMYFRGLGDWTAKDYDTAAGDYDTATTVAGVFGPPGLGAAMTAAKGFGNMYGKYKNDNYSSFGQVAGDALGAVASTALASGGLRNSANPVGRFFGNTFGRISDPFYAGVSRATSGIANGIGRFARSPYVSRALTNFDDYVARKGFGNSFAPEAGQFFMRDVGKRTGQFVTPSEGVKRFFTQNVPEYYKRVVPFGAKQMVQGAKTLAGTYMPQVLSGVEGALAGKGVTNYAITPTQNALYGKPDSNINRFGRFAKNQLISPAYGQNYQETMRK